MFTSINITLTHTSEAMSKVTSTGVFTHVDYI
jgi:hypothetical protein